jgi:hypothetical protein
MFHEKILFIFIVHKTDINVLLTESHITLAKILTIKGEVRYKNPQLLTIKGKNRKQMQ